MFEPSHVVFLAFIYPRTSYKMKVSYNEAGGVGGGGGWQRYYPPLPCPGDLLLSLNTLYSSVNNLY